MLPDEVSHVEVTPVGAERNAFGEAAHLGLRDLAHRLSLDLEERHVGFFVPIEGGLGACRRCHSRRACLSGKPGRRLLDSLDVVKKTKMRNRIGRHRDHNLTGPLPCNSAVSST
jgi:hypothetical protein